MFISTAVNLSEPQAQDITAMVTISLSTTAVPSMLENLKRSDIWLLYSFDE